MSDEMLKILPTGGRKKTEMIPDEDEGQLAMDIYETDDTIFLIAPVAGVDESSVEVVISEDLLTIKGNRPRPDFLPVGKYFFLEECYWGGFARSVLLPTAINSADMSARIDHDIIIVEVPKARKLRSKKISFLSKK